MKITQRNYKPIKINQETTNKRNEASIKKSKNLDWENVKKND